MYFNFLDAAALCLCFDLIVLIVEGSHRELPSLLVLRDASYEVKFLYFLILFWRFRFIKGLDIKKFAQLFFWSGVVIEQLLI